MFFDYNDVNFSTWLSLLKWYAVFENNIIEKNKALVFIGKQVLR